MGLCWRCCSSLACSSSASRRQSSCWASRRRSSVSGAPPARSSRPRHPLHCHRHPGNATAPQTEAPSCATHRPRHNEVTGSATPSYERHPKAIKQQTRVVKYSRLSVVALVLLSRTQRVRLPVVATTVAPAGALGARLRLVHTNRPVVEHRPIEGRDCVARVVVVSHLNKAEAL